MTTDHQPIPDNADVERVFAEDLLAQARRLGVRAGPVETPGHWRDRVRCAAISSLTRGETNSGAETWESINQWCDDTFGKATIPQIIDRAKEEFVELEEPGANHAIEAADVVICLCRIPGFAEALQSKMAINRKRKWRLTGDGTGYHIPDASPSTEGSGTSEQVMLPPKATRDWAVRLANIRQGQNSTQRCEPPGEYAVNRAFQDIRDVLAALPVDSKGGGK